MASNRFNQRPVPHRRPSICHPPPVIPYPPVPPTKPRNLAGFARWTDLDPALEFKPDVHSYIDLQLINPTPTYEGSSPKNRFHLVVRVQLQTPPDLFLVTLELWQLGSLSESHPWSAVRVTIPFDTGLLTDILIPHQDYRLARFLE